MVDGRFLSNRQIEYSISNQLIKIKIEYSKLKTNMQFQINYAISISIVNHPIDLQVLIPGLPSGPDVQSSIRPQPRDTVQVKPESV
jgi:hypothetical protein